MKTVSPEVNFPENERKILEKWQRQGTFDKQNKKRQDAKEFAFYDGPPFANGLPHYGHLLANTVKDVVPRYWTMKGYKVERRFGWDCHGLPVEFEIEKTTGLKGRQDILALGVSEFNKLCKDSVSHFTREWQKTITRLGRWVDWNNQYRTMDPEFMESVWWVFSELYKKGLIYQGFKVVPYSPRTGSVVSNFEANQNYKNTQDPAITVKLAKKGETSTYFVIWTTTPWTLPSNLALAVGPDIDYVKVFLKEKKEHWILAKDRLDVLLQKVLGKDYKDATEVVASLKGKELLGQSYQPLFDFFQDEQNAFRVIGADFVNTQDGTGIVHLAPAFGEDDFFACRKERIALVDPLDESAHFTAKVPPYQGLYIKDADKKIIKDLKDKDLLVWQETIDHSYPFDERTDTPLIYKAVPSWYVAVEKFVPALVENNKQINWVPGHVKAGRMGTWLENARDWAISRNRFWGTPLPVWICEQNKDHIEVFSCQKDLESRFGEKIADLHKEFLQPVTFACQSCQGTMKTVDLVFDCWFESGSMPYAQLHYPFANKERFAQIFPADFIGEGLDQTRGWFYTLSVLSTALFNKPAFKNVVVNGVILDEAGKKMSKRKKNYTPPDDLIELYGADSVRLYMLSSQLLKAENLIFQDKGVKDITRLILLPLWNAYSFLSTYALANNYKPKAELLTEDHALTLEHPLDRFIVSRLYSMCRDVEEQMQNYHLYLVTHKVLSFIEDLTNWYIRLSRRRFWGEEGKLTSDQEQAFDSLFYVLERFLRIFAPFAPFVACELYANLTEGLDASESVHLADLPKIQEGYIDAKLERKMATIRQVVNLGRSLRAQHKLKTRQVLAGLLVITQNQEDKETIAFGEEIIRQELNVKTIEFSMEEDKHVRLSLLPKLTNLGKRLGKELGGFRNHLAEINKTQASVSEFLRNLKKNKSYTYKEFELSEDDFILERSPLGEKLIATENEVTVVLDTHITRELELEGYARELVNRIQNLRKDKNLNVSDRIHIELSANPLLTEAARLHQDYILRETLGLGLALLADTQKTSLEHEQELDIEGMKANLGLSVAKKG